MRKVYKNRDEEAVSPVIATILMVAITVVLAAVLYVMVIGMGGGTTNTAPAGSITFSGTNQTATKVTFGTFSPTPAPLDIKIILTPTGAGNPVALTFPNAPTTATTAMTSDTAGVTGSYYDYQPTGNTVNAGDYLTINGLTSGTTYTVTIFHNPSSSTCSLVGSVTFTTA